jgi:hypothetical protein
MESLNRMAVELVDEAIDFAGELNVDVLELDSGATVLDFGVEAAGGIEAGLLLAEIQTAGLATIQTRMDEVAGAPFPYVELTTDKKEVLVAMYSTGDMDGMPLASILGKDSSQVSMLLQDLEEDGLIQDSADGPTLTPSGKVVASRHLEDVNA